MSGGAFDHKQFHIDQLIEDMETLLKRIDKEPIDSFECDSLSNYVEDKESFKATILTNIQHLKMAYIYTQRIDWFVSGDDSEETMYERIEEDIGKI